MSNMSYCQFRNTLRDLRECSDTLDAEGVPDSADEYRAAVALIRLCAEISQSYGHEVVEFDERNAKGGKRGRHH